VSRSWSELKSRLEDTLHRLPPLPWVRERLRVALTPDRIVVAWGGRGITARVDRCDSFPCRVEPGQSPWHGAVQTLRDVLDASGDAGGDVEVILSSHFVRYTVVPWRDDISDDAERDAMARYILANVYGDTAGTWAVRVSAGQYGAAALAAAVDEELLRELRSPGPAGFRTVSVQPWLMSVVGQFRETLGDRGCLVLGEPGRLTVAQFGEGGWQFACSRRLGADVDLPAGLARELGASEIPVTEGDFWCFGPELPGLDWAAAGVPAPVRLDLPRPVEPGYAMALCGAL
jgi:hypothetical protein